MSGMGRLDDVLRVFGFIVIGFVVAILFASSVTTKRTEFQSRGGGGGKGLHIPVSEG